MPGDMLTMRLNGHYLELYDSIDELPFARFQEYNRAVLIDSGLGSDFAAIDRHITQARRYNAAGEKQHAEQALLNMREAVNMVLEKVSPESRAFVCLIRRMNGNEVTDLSDDNVTAIIRDLSRAGLTVGKLRGAMERIKKNWTESWRHFSRTWQIRPRRKNTTQP